MGDIINVCTWNVNSINVRLNQVLELLFIYNIDILMIQEIKCQFFLFPDNEFKKNGYYSYFISQKSYNGVAIISKFPINGRRDFLIKDDDSARYLDVLIDIFDCRYRIINVYVPNGGVVNSEYYNYKLFFLDELCNIMKSYSYEDNVILAGDFNVALDDIDVYDADSLRGSICFSIQEQNKMRYIINNLGYCDSFRVFNNNLQEFSWWDYRGNSYNLNQGMRIDMIICSGKIMDNIIKVTKVKDFRSKIRPSDHCPVIAKININ